MTRPPATLTALDSVFLRLETPRTPLHIGSVAVLDGPAPAREQIAALLRDRVATVPRLRQVLRDPALRLRRPVWADAPGFDPGAHLHCAALPRPGGRAELQHLVELLMSSPLDRARPLWEVWIVEGLAGGRWAVVAKAHHCLLDGLAGTSLLASILTPWCSPSEVVDPLPTVPVTDDERPTGTARPGLTARAGAALAGVRGVAAYARLVVPPARSSLAGPLGTARSWRALRFDLAGTRAAGKVAGATVNDIVLAAVTRGFRELLLARGEKLRPDVVRSLVPVSTRTAEQRGVVDNRITAMVATLPVDVAGPGRRLAAVHAILERLKHSGEPEGGALVSGLAELAPPALVYWALAAIARIPQWMLVSVTTNVPGPAVPLYCLGHRVRELYPYVPIADRIRVGVAAESYDGSLFVGVTADGNSMPDIDTFTAGFRAELDELTSVRRDAPKTRSRS
jgi:diacylglycerol O-acyltransferase